MSVYFAGEVTPHIGTFLEMTGGNDQGGSFGLGGSDLVLIGSDKTIANKSFVYGLSLEDMVGFDDPTNAGPGNWGLNSTLNPLSTHNTLFDPFPGNVEGGEAYFMWGDFNSGGLYGSLGVFDPNNHKGGNVDGAPPVATLGNIAQNGNFDSAKHADGYLRVEYWLPEFKNIYSEIGAYDYFGSEYMLPPSTASIASKYTDNVNDYGLDFQAQYIKGSNLFELFGLYQKQHDSEFYGTDQYTGISYGNGTSVNRKGVALKADYYYKRTYGIYAKYMYGHSGKVQDVDYSGYIIGLSFYPWQNFNIRIEREFWSKYNPGVAQYGGENSGVSASDFDTTAIKFEYLY